MAVSGAAVAVGVLEVAVGLSVSAVSIKNFRDDFFKFQQEGEGKGDIKSKGPGQSSKGLIGKDFEEYLNKELGGEGSRQVGGRDFDGVKGNRWWEAKSGQSIKDWLTKKGIPFTEILD